MIDLGRRSAPEGRPAEVRFRACNLCEAICGLEIRVRGGEIVEIRGDPRDSFSRGHVCPKAVALQDIQSDSDRLRQPLRRRPRGGWEEIGWNDAFDETATRIRAIQSEHGRDAVGVYLGNPNVHNYGSLLFGSPLLRTLRTSNRFSATSVDQLPHHLVAWLMFGHQLMLPIPDLDRTGLLLVLGANPAASNGSMMTAPGVTRRLKELRRRGGRLIVIDPRRTETARLADRHLFVRPGTDALLLAALIHTLFDEGLDRPGRLSELCRSEGEVRERVAALPPERVAATVGIDAEEIRGLAREFAAASAAVCYGRMGVSTQAFGSLCQWLVNVLNILTGNLDHPGGAMFTRPAVDLLSRVSPGHLGRWQSRVRGLPEFGNELPSVAMAEEMLTPGPRQIRALITSAGNPVLSTPNGPQLERALAGLDFMVSIDLYLNETTRHAHLILPPTAPLEHDHYDLVFNALAVRNVARYSPALFEPSPDARHDWQILSELNRRLDSSSFKSRLQHRIAARLGPRGQLALALRFGPYGSGLHPWRRGLTLKKLEQAPHGLDLGPLEPCLPARLRTADRRIDLAPRRLVEDLPRLHRLLETSGDARPGSFLLIGRRHVRSNNSWMHNYPRLMRGRQRCTLLMHSRDARRLGLVSGQRVSVASGIGHVEVALEISDEVAPGVVSLPHGWGHHRPGTRLSTATLHPGVSLNDLTDHRLIDPVSGNAALNGLAVRIQPASRIASGNPPGEAADER